MPGADASRGREIIMKLGCGSCHTIPGIGWPQGRVGPALDSFAERSLIAGQLPNQPAVLAAFVRNAPALKPATTMPAMAMTERESRDVAAYLYSIGVR